MKTNFLSTMTAAVAVAAGFALSPTEGARLSGSYNVPKYIADNGEGTLKVSHTWVAKSKLPRKMSDMSATTFGDAVILVGGCAQDQGYMEFGGDNSTWGMCKSDGGGRLSVHP